MSRPLLAALNRKKMKSFFARSKVSILLSLYLQKMEIFDCQSIFDSICEHYTYLKSADESWSRTRSATPSRPALYTDRIRLSIFRVRFFSFFLSRFVFLEKGIESLEKATYMQISISKSILFSHSSRGPIFSLELKIDINKEVWHLFQGPSLV